MHPVVKRELIVVARHPSTFSMRMLAVGSLVAVAFVFASENIPGRSLGPRLFTAVHATLFFAIWILVPLMTGDSISREKREGTLSILSLTTLSFAEVAWAKCVAQGLRAFSLWLAVLPAMIIPLLVGGVSWQEILFSAMVNFSSILLALCAGMLASSCSKVLGRSLVLAAILATALAVTLSVVLGWAFSAALRASGAAVYDVSDEMWWWFTGGFSLAVNWRELWQVVLVSGPSGASIRSYIIVALFSIGLSYGLMKLVGWNVKRNWREQAPAAWRLWLEEKLCRPVFFRRLLGWWMSRQLERNPIGWLEQRTWSGRLVMWSWFAVVISVYSTVFTDFNLLLRAFLQIQVLVAWLLAGSMAISAAGSFRRERDTGVLELLLVAPLREKDIVLGRVRGLWNQFLPAIALLYGVWLYLAGASVFPANIPAMIFFFFVFISVPVVGLYFSLSSRSVLGAFIRTVTVITLVPFAPSAIFQLLRFFDLPTSSPYGPGPGLLDPWRSILVSLAQIGCVLLVGTLLHRKLKSRNFAFVSASR